MCRACIAKLVKDDPTVSSQKMLTSVRDELKSTISSFKTLVEKMQAPVQPSTPAQAPPSLNDPVGLEEEVSSSHSSGGEQEGSGSGEEHKGNDSHDSSNCKLSLEDVDNLLKAVYTTLEIEEEEVHLSKHDLMYTSHKKNARVFPVHSSLLDVIKQEWNSPDKKPFFPRTLKRRYPFDNSGEQPWNKIPKVDASLSRISKGTDLAFEDSGALKDPMDKRTDVSLRRVWEASIMSLKPALASTCIARHLELWLSQIQTHLSAGTSREQINKSFPLLFQAIGFLADSSAEAVRMAARTSALANTARRSLWLKTWSGDVTSKSRLCGLPFTGDHLFGPGLTEALERTADKKKGFPEKKFPYAQRNVRGRGKQQKSFETQQNFKKHWTGHKGKGRGNILFNPPQHPGKPQ